MSFQGERRGVRIPRRKLKEVMELDNAEEKAGAESDIRNVVGSVQSADGNVTDD